jgi:2-aminoadipate transaminase
METAWDHRFAQRTQRMQSSAIRELLKLVNQPDVISFAGGLPGPDVFPIEEFNRACSQVLTHEGALALQYGTTEGYQPLREKIAEITSHYGIGVTADNILITSGSQQALDLLGKIFINPGDKILTEAPTYLGAIQAWNTYGAEYVTVRSDNNGMITDDLERALRYGPKFIYVLPNFQNPSGTTLSLERRIQLVDLAERYGIPIVEDDPYGQLRYEGEHIPAVEVLDCRIRETKTCYSGNVIYLSTFSKTLAPGLRLAWVVAPPEVIRKLVQAKQGTDLHTATFNQVVAYEVLKNGFLNEHINLIRSVYRERRDTMLNGLASEMPAGVQWTHPEGGLFLWATLPEEMDTSEIFSAAVQEKVAFVPGASFFPLGGGFNTMRLNFSYSNPEQIEMGIKRLAKVIRKFM